MTPPKRDSFGKQSKGIFLRFIFTNRAHAKIAKMPKKGLFLRCDATSAMCKLCVGPVHIASSYGRLFARQCDDAHTFMYATKIHAGESLTIDIHDNDGHPGQDEQMTRRSA
jgi:hypothetical protein